MSTAALLDREEFNTRVCRDGETLLEEIVQRRPDVVVYCLRPEQSEDLGVLRLLRRISPDLPLVVMASSGSLFMQKQVQAFRPVYYGVCPMDRGELEAAVRAACLRSAPEVGARGALTSTANRKGAT
jgi:DNA-binding NtrC family response regulator